MQNLQNRYEKEGYVYLIGCDDVLQMICLLTKRSCVLEKQTIQTSTAIMNDLTRIGDYELLEKENEGYEQESTQLGVESGLMNTKHAVGIPMRLY